MPLAVPSARSPARAPGHRTVSCVDDLDDIERPHHAELLRVLSQVEGWLARMDPSVGSPRPIPGSPLRADDDRMHPSELSHAVWHSLSHSVDHLNCLRSLLKDAQVIHMFAPYSLVRPALENASAAVWMLQPRRRAERIARRLRLATDDIRNNEQARRLAGMPGPRSEHERLDQVREIADRAGVAKDEALRRLGYREIVEAASGADGPRAAVIPLCWRLCSGMAHGDFWPTFSASERVELPGAPPGVGAFKITANVNLLMYVTTFAVKMTELGWHLYDQRSRSPF
jgi:hypothetical protein